MSTDAGSERRHAEPSHGNLSEEASKLADALAAWLGQNAAGAAHMASAATDGMGQSPECRLCPFCQLLRMLRGARPEVFEHLTEAGTAMAAALRAALESSGASWAAGRRPTSQRIHID